MVHNSIHKRFLFLITTFIIVVFSVLSYSSVSYALPKLNRETGEWEDVGLDVYFDELGIGLAYITSSLGAVADHDFYSFVSAQKEWDNYWNEDNISVDTDTGEITFSEDLVKYIKQALKEYQNEQYGYQILPTLKYDQIPVSAFSCATNYRTMCELVKTYGYIYINPSTMEINDVSPYIDGTSGFYVQSYFSDGSIYTNLMNFITWQQPLKLYLTYSPKDLNTVELCTTFDELKSAIDNINSSDNGYGQYSYKTNGIVIRNSFNNSAVLVSYSGSDVLVFNNETSLKNYSVDKRGVFTTKDFYEDTGELTLKLDDLNNSIGDLTDLLSQFKNLLGKQEGGLTEEQLQQLLQQFLDDFFNRLGDNDDNTGGGSSGGGTSGGISSGDIKNGILDALSGYYESILSYLDGILYEIQNLELISLTTGGSNSGDDSTDLLDMFDNVWKDPENNAQEFADKLQQPFSEIASGITKKFPFSIPWDIYGIFTILSGVEAPQTASTFSLYSESPGDSTANIENIETTATVYSRDSNGSEHSAPYFELPIVINSFGIEEYIVVDLKDFQSISTLSRTMLALLFGVFLMKFTIKIVDLFKGGTDS